METKRIYCYTGTGNCLAAAKQIAEALGETTVKFIKSENSDGSLEVVCDVCVLVYPSYAYGVPKLVKQFLKKTRFSVGYMALVCTYGSSMRGTNAEAVKLLRKNGQAVHYAGGSQSVENYVHMFGHPKPDYQQERQEKQTENIAAVCKALQNRETNTVKLLRPFSAFVSFAFRTAKVFFPKFYKIKKTCNNCEICRRVCPTSAITMREQKRGNSVRKIPRFKARKCDHCQACMQLCPQKAIHYFRIKPSSPRYLHKDVSLRELIKRD